MWASQDSNPKINDLAQVGQLSAQRNEHDANWLPSLDTFRTFATRLAL
jgi:hypothetical protein